MISHTTLTDIRESTKLVETTAKNIEALTVCGYSEDEIISLLWLRQRYQNGGSDRAAVVRYLEFLRDLVSTELGEARRQVLHQRATVRQNVAGQKKPPSATPSSDAVPSPSEAVA